MLKFAMRGRKLASWEERAYVLIWSDLSSAKSHDVGFSFYAFPFLAREIFQNGPQQSRARAWGAAERTLDGEDRSETLA